MLIVPTALHGYEIEAIDGRLGTVKDFLFDDRSWRSRWIVVDTGGWLTGRRVLLHPSAFDAVDHDAKVLRVNLTQQQVKNSPTIDDHQPITMETERSQYQYYSWDPFWGDSMIGMMPGGPLVGAAQMVEGDSAFVTDAANGYDQPDPNLRSIADIKDYHVSATDGEIGHVHNMLIEDATFAVGYLILNTSDWWMGKNVLVTPRDVVSLQANERTITLNLTRDQIKLSPQWDPSAVVRAETEEVFPTKRYNWPGNRSA